MTLTELKFLLNKYRLTANKIRGQNFLISDDVLDDIIKTANLSKEDLVLEVGPGLGALTTRLSASVGQVVALEVDKNLEPLLVKLVASSNNLEIIWQDILSFGDKQWQDIMDKHSARSYKIVANIPYYLTAKFIRKFLTSAILPQSMTIMVQKEVAQRITDPVKQSLLSLAVNFYAQSDLVRIVSKNNFFPSPKVDSAILHIHNIHKWKYDVSEKQTWQIIKRGFAAKRKKLINNLSTDPKVDKEKLKLVMIDLKIDLGVRAESLEASDWLNLAKKL